MQFCILHATSIETIFKFKSWIFKVHTNIWRSEQTSIRILAALQMHSLGIRIQRSRENRISPSKPTILIANFTKWFSHVTQIHRNKRHALLLLKINIQCSYFTFKASPMDWQHNPLRWHFLSSLFKHIITSAWGSNQFSQSLSVGSTMQNSSSCDEVIWSPSGTHWWATRHCG